MIVAAFPLLHSFYYFYYFIIIIIIAATIITDATAIATESHNR